MWCSSSLAARWQLASLPAIPGSLSGEPRLGGFVGFSALLAALRLRQVTAAAAELRWAQMHRRLGGGGRVVSCELNVARRLADLLRLSCTGRNWPCSSAQICLDRSAL